MTNEFNFPKRVFTRKKFILKTVTNTWVNIYYYLSILIYFAQKLYVP